MSHHATNWAIRQRGLKPATKIVLWHLADCHNPAHGCFPTQAYLAEQCEMNRDTVNVHLNILEERGLIRRERSFDPGTKQQRPTRYHLAVDGESKGRSGPEASVSENPTGPQDVGGPAQDVAEPVSEFPTVAVSDFEAEPCRNSNGTRVGISDSNPVREPLREPVKGRASASRGEAAIPDKARLPDNWALSDEGWAYARSQKIPDEVIEDEARGFHAYWTDRTDRDSKKSARGWEQCWANRCRNIAPRYQQGRGMARGAQPGGGQFGGSIASIAAKRRLAGQV